MTITLQRVTSLHRRAQANAPAASYWLRRVTPRLDESIVQGARGRSLQCAVASLTLAGNGVMEYYEFVDLMSRVSWGEQGGVDELSSAVHALFDHEHDGLASATELRRLLTSLGEPLTDEQLDIMMKQLSPDGDGRLTCAGIVVSSCAGHRNCDIVIYYASWQHKLKNTRTQNQNTRK